MPASVTAASSTGVFIDDGLQHLFHATVHKFSREAQRRIGEEIRSVPFHLFEIIQYLTRLPEQLKI